MQLLMPLDERECHCVLCTQRPPDTWNDQAALGADMVNHKGWGVLGIFGSSFEWAYSIGLWHTFGSPEVCIIGMGHQAASKYVNIVAEQVRDGNPLDSTQIRTGVLGGWDDTLALAPVHDTWYARLFGSAISFYQRPPIPVVQLVWPDGAGRFLWDPQADAAYRDLQPQLYAPRDEDDTRWT